MVRRILRIAALLFVGLLSYIYLFNVNPKDVVAYNGLSTPVASEAFRAGDLVAISPDGQSVGSRICSMDLPQEDLDMIPLSKQYSNALRESVPDFANMVGWVKDLAGAERTEAPSLTVAHRVPFEGRMSQVRDAEVNPPMSGSCVCQVAKALQERKHICTVRRSLVETRLEPSVLNDAGSPQVLRERTVGVTFRSSSIVIPDLSVLSCPPGMINPEARAASQPFNCGAVGGHAVDVLLRNKLGVIQETDAMLAAGQ